MNCERQDRKPGCSLGELVEALYDEVLELPVSDPAKKSLVAIMLGNIMHREGRTIFLQARPRPAIRRAAAVLRSS